MFFQPRFSISGQKVCRTLAVGGVLALMMFASLALASPLAAQTADIHYRRSGDMPPGAIGRWQLRRGGPLPGYVQPVEIRAPRGVLISLAVDGQFDEPQPAPRTVGVLIGCVYRLRVTGIALMPEAEVYPTIEVIDRLYPPPGKELKFPIPVELTQDELRLAAQGNMVTRVIYLEDPRQALPAPEIEGRQTWFEAAVGDDPLKVADTLGRPMALLRMGGLVPTAGQRDEHFFYGWPPLMIFPRAALAPQDEAVAPRAAPPPETVDAPAPQTPNGQGD